MRISNRYISTNILRSIQGNMGKLVRSQEQLATSKRLLRLSDDPNVMGQFMKIKSTLSYNQQYSRNIDDGLGYLEMNDAAMGTVGNVLAKALEYTTQAANDTYNAADRKAIGHQIDKMIDQVIDLANSTVGGKYIYAGMKNSHPPFKRVGDTITYHGDTNGVYREVLSGTGYRIDAPGVTKGFSVNFVDTPDNPAKRSVLPEVTQRQEDKAATGVLRLKFLDNKIFVVGQYNLDGINPVENLITIPKNVSGNVRVTAVPDTAINLAAGSYRVVVNTDGVGVRTAVLQDAQGSDLSTVELDPVESSVVFGDYGINFNYNGVADGTIEFDITENRHFELSNLSFTVAEGDLAGLSIKLPENIIHGAEYLITVDNRQGLFGNLETNSNIVYDPNIQKDLVDRGIFDALFTLRDRLFNNDSAGLQKSIDELQKSVDHNLQYRVTIGARHRHFESLKTHMMDLELNLTQSLELLEGADMARLSIEYAQHQLSYNASLAISANIMKTSLLDFLR